MLAPVNYNYDQLEDSKVVHLAAKSADVDLLVAGGG